MKYQIYLSISEMQPTFWACRASTKISANRAKMQIYLLFSEVPRRGNGAFACTRVDIHDKFVDNLWQFVFAIKQPAFQVSTFSFLT